MTPSRTCRVCSEEKPIQAFPVSRLSRGGHTWKCRLCVAEADRQRYHEGRRRDPVAFWSGVALNAARQRARKASLPFALTLPVLIGMAPAACPVLGIPLDYTGGQGQGKRVDESPSLDKLIPPRGYVPENCRVISWRANHLKGDATLEEVELIAAYMRRETMKETP